MHLLFYHSKIISNFLSFINSFSNIMSHILIVKFYPFCCCISISSRFFCNVKSCCHNEDNCCCLSSIEVNGSNACNCEDTCCGSYFEDKSGEKNSAQTPHVSLSIACQATNCMYNDDKVCHADHVDISGIRATAADETVCATFQEK